MARPSWLPAEDPVSTKPRPPCERAESRRRCLSSCSWGSQATCATRLPVASQACDTGADRPCRPRNGGDWWVSPSGKTHVGEEKNHNRKGNPKAPDLTVNLAWPDGNGFTQCSNEYYAISMALESSNPAHSASPTPEDYEQYAALLRDRTAYLRKGTPVSHFASMKADRSRRVPARKFG